LKTSEGTADFLLELMQSEARQENALDIEKILNPIQQRLHHAEFPGAILCGVEGIVIKCHGESTPRSFYNAILGALGLIDNGFLAKIKKQLETV
jgi:glycerol-3-phosphate acyltransferase PlsX